MGKTIEKRWFIQMIDGKAVLMRQATKDFGWPIAESCGYGVHSKCGTGTGILRRCARLLNADDARRRKERDDGAE